MIEFQAVLLAAGKGSRMNNLAEAKGKCLLPIGNYPMIWYPLKFLESKGFNEVIVIVPENVCEIVQSLQETYNFKIKLDVVSVPEDEDLGTADAIRLIRDKIKTDILVMSSDLITNVDLDALLRIHRNHNSSVTALFSEVSELKFVPGQKEKHKREYDLIGIDPNTKRLVFITSEADLDEMINFRKNILKQHPVIQIRRDLMDAHLYLMKNWVINFINDKEDLVSLKGEILPTLIKMQHKSKVKEVCQEETDVECGNTKLGSILPPDVKLVESISSWNDHHGDLNGPYHEQNLRCYGLIADENDICIRVNTTAMYFDLNCKIANIWQKLYSTSENIGIHPSAKVINKTQISPDTLVGENTSISDKVSIKQCVIGNNCTIDGKVRLTNCILMDNVTVKEGNILHNTILCDKVVIEDGCDIKDCIVDYGQSLQSGGKFSREIVADTGRMMEI